MSSSVSNQKLVEPTGVQVTNTTLRVDLSDGRAILAPLTWYPRLRHGTPRERARFELGSFGIHWPDLDEDISVDGLLRGEKSGESMRSLQRWLDQRKHGRSAGAAPRRPSARKTK